MRSEYEMEMMRGQLGRLFRHLAYELRMNAKTATRPTEPLQPSEPVDYAKTPPRLSQSLLAKLAEITAENEI